LTIAYGRFLGATKLGELYFATTFAALIGFPLEVGFNQQLSRDVAQAPEKALRYLSNTVLLKAVLWLVLYGVLVVLSWRLGYSAPVRVLVAICGMTLLSSGIATGLSAAYYAFGDPGTLAGPSRTSRTPQSHILAAALSFRKNRRLLHFEPRTQGQIMMKQGAACCSSPATMCYWFVVSVAAWGALSLIGIYWHPLHASSAVACLFAMAIGCLANWFKNHSFHCAITGPLFMIAGALFLASEVHIIQINESWLWSCVVIGVGMAFLLEWMYARRRES